MTRKSDFNLPTFEDLFKTQKERDEDRLDKIRDIPLSEIDSFPGHPFKVRDDEDMSQLVESVREHGVMTPAVLRKKEDGRYELVAGHRRKRACELAGLDTLRSEVKDLTRDEAIVYMVESNFQQTTILPSEKAFAYRMRLEALNRQGHRSDLTSAPLGQKLSREQLATQTGNSHSQIQRYIRLTYLIPELLQLVDDGRMKMRPAVELSYLSEACQRDVYEQIELNQATPSHDQAIRMCKIHGNLRRFNSIMEQIKLAPDDILYVLGDVIDRYPDGIRILRKLMSMENAKMIMGNHEYMMLDVLYKNDEGLSAKDQYKYDQRVRLWYDSGGLETHNYLKHIRKSVRAEIFSYLKLLPVNIDITVNGINYKLAHAAPEEMYYDFKSTRDRDSREFSVWHRLGVNESIPGEYTLIIGHTTTYHYSRSLPMSICRKGRFICIDCGAGTPKSADYRNGFCYGRLACLRLDDMKEFYSEEGNEYEESFH